MKRINRLIGWVAILLSLSSAAAMGDDAATIRHMCELVKPSLVAVKYTWASELGSQELSAAGVIINGDGLVVIPIGIVTPAIVPDDQMHRFKIVVPSETGDDTEVDATLQGRDERSSLAFVRADSPQKWKAIQFVDASPQIGDPLYSVGILPKGAGYKALVTTAFMSTRLRGPVPQMLVGGQLAGVGAIVLNAKGQAIGYVHARSLAESLLDNPENPDDLPMVNAAPRLFIPASDFLPSIQNPPSPDKPIVLPWIGCEMKGLEKEDAEYFGLENVPAVQVGDVVPDSPASKAGLNKLDVITQINGKPIERGDLPDELPEIVTRQIQRMNVGDKVTFSVIRAKGDVPKQVVLTLEARPKEPHEAKRFYAKDLGFVAREVTFVDTYRRKISMGTGGVVVALLRPQAAAQAARLEINDLITQMNGKAVNNLDEFKKDYLEFRKERPNDPVVLEVTELDGQQRTINIEPPQTDVQPGM
ncbi:MAG TPA: PDZ domain-containing protein [Tepidisphaeraceae bacterium]|jgi:serine protease Do|nr:PDZ domain-containing protein [Tepidisphaeraceae bacterium]